jgi:EpsI family protein
MVAVGLAGIFIVGIAPASALKLAPTKLMDAGRASAPRVELPWKVADRDLQAWRPRFAAPTAEFLRTYTTGNAVVKLYVASYSADQPDVKLSSAINVLFEDPWWMTAQDKRRVTIEGQSFNIRETVLRSRDSSLVVWSWYWVDQTFTGDDWFAKVLLAKARLFRSSHSTAAMAIATENQTGERAVIVLQDFLAHLSLAPSLNGRPAAGIE